MIEEKNESQNGSTESLEKEQLHTFLGITIIDDLRISSMDRGPAF
jgi:hypothetical protein